jgi:hypothetical protein
MRRPYATLLTMLLCAHPLLAESPLTRSVAREAARLAAPPADDRSAWRAVRLLEPGARIVITTADAAVDRAFVGLRDSTLTVRNGSAEEEIALDEVLMIESRVRRGSAAAAVFGTLGGIWLGSAVALNLTYSRCHACGAVRLAAWGAFIGIPIAGGYGAWYGSSRLTEEVIYRRPQTARP